MPQLTKGRVPQYRHYKARNLACVDIDGQRLYLGHWKTKASYTEYDRLIGEWLTHGRVLPQEADEPERLTVTELIAQYVSHAKGYYRRDGREYEAIVTAVKPLKPLYGGGSRSSRLDRSSWKWSGRNS